MRSCPHSIHQPGHVAALLVAAAAPKAAVGTAGLGQAIPGELLAMHTKLLQALQQALVGATHGGAVGDPKSCAHCLQCVCEGLGAWAEQSQVVGCCCPLTAHVIWRFQAGCPIDLGAWQHTAANPPVTRKALVTALAATKAFPLADY